MARTILAEQAFTATSLLSMEKDMAKIGRTRQQWVEATLDMTRKLIKLSDGTPNDLGLFFTALYGEREIDAREPDHSAFLRLKKIVEALGQRYRGDAILAHIPTSGDQIGQLVIGKIGSFEESKEAPYRLQLKEGRPEPAWRPRPVIEGSLEVAIHEVESPGEFFRTDYGFSEDVRALKIGALSAYYSDRGGIIHRDYVGEIYQGSHIDMNNIIMACANLGERAVLLVQDFYRAKAN